MTAFTVFVSDEEDTPVSGVSVGVFSETGMPVMSTLTDVDGAALLVTDEAETILVLSKSGYTFKHRYYLAPDEGDAFDIVGTALHIAPPEDASKCRVYGRILDPLSKCLSKKWQFTVKLCEQVATAESDDIITTSAKVSHDDGFVVMDLIRGARYELSPLPLSSAKYATDEYDELSKVSFSVPESSVARLVDLIAPRVKHVILQLNSVTLEAQSNVSIDIQVTLTNELTAEHSSEYVALLSSDTEVATASISHNSLSIAALSVGSCTINVISQRARSTAESMFYRPSPETVLSVIEVEVI